MMEAMLDTSTNNLRIFNACCSLYCAICIDIEMNYFVFYFLLSSHDVHNKEPNDQWPFCHALVGLSDWGCASKIAFHSSVPFFFFFFRVISIHFSVSFECKCKCVEVHFTVGIHETKKKTGKKKAPQRTQFIHACIQVVSDLSARVLFVVEHFETKSMKRLEEFVSNYEWFAAQTRSFTMTTQLVATNYLPKMYRNARQ